MLWYKEAPDAPGSGADAPGMWITDKTAVKAAYKQVFAYNVGDGKPTWDPHHLPAEDLRGHPAEDGRRQGRRRVHERHQRQRQVQPAPADRPDTGKKGWTEEVADGALFDSTLSVELSIAGNTLMVGRSQSGTGYDVSTGKKLCDKKKYGAACFPTAFAGGDRLIIVASCGAGRDGHRARRGRRSSTRPPARSSGPRSSPRAGASARVYSARPARRLLTNEDKKTWNICRVQGRHGSPAPRSPSTRTSRPSAAGRSSTATCRAASGAAADADHALPADRGEDRRQRDRRHQPGHRQGEVARQVPRRTSRCCR